MQMTLQTLFEQINTAYRGSDDDAPALGTVDGDLWLHTVNRKIAEWARDSKNDWESLFENRNIDTVVLSQQQYDLPEDLLTPANKVVITDTDGHTHDYRIYKPQEADRYTRWAAYITGIHPQVLNFVDDLSDATSTLIGGTITMPAYYQPGDLEEEDDIVPVDDPYWLVYAVASELAFNDLTYEDKAIDLNAKALSIYKQMTNNNRRGSNYSPRTVPTRVDRIGGMHNEGLRSI